MSARKQRASGRSHVIGKEGFADREEESGTEKTRPKKRKLSDLLGPPWSEEDLKHFYQSYRRHGRDWKKVAASFQDRTVEMVEVLYRMNKAYLSLPEGVASAAGLIAMMTDHRNILEESNSFGYEDADESSKEIVGSPPPNRTLSRSRNMSPVVKPINRSKHVPQVSGISSYGGPSPSKKPRTVAVNRPRTVWKRTPRFPPMHLQDKKSSEKSIAESMEDKEQDSFGECDELKVALTLAASASQRVSSPQVSRTPMCNTGKWKNSPGQNGCSKHVISTGSESSDSKHTGSNMDGGEDGGSEESRDIESGVVTKGIANMTDSQRRYMYIGEGNSRPRRAANSQSRKGKIQGFERFRSDDLKEECSCTDEGVTKQENVKVGDGLIRETVSKKKRLPSQKTKNRSRQLFSGDERNGLDALATLADLCFLPSPRRESEPPSWKSVEPNKAAETERVVSSAGGDQASHAGMSYGPSMGTSNMHSKTGLLGSSKEIFIRQNSNDKTELEAQKIVELKKRKRRVVSDKRDQFSDGNGELEEKVSLHSEELVNRMQVKRTFLGKTPSKYVGRAVKQEPDQEPEIQEGVVGDAKLEQMPMLDMVKLLARQGNRRKTKHANGSVRTFIPHSSIVEENSSDKIRLIHCLSSAKARQWCIHEWFYSAIDLPWFARNEFVEYLNHAGLGHVPRLTRAEWGVIRGSLGKPRRLSKRFLKEEREKLEAYRDSVRKHYKDVRTGHLGGLPRDLPRPLTVGQRVIARHPKSKEHCIGSILTVDWNRCRVQFEHQEMGVELVADIDCMPINSLESVSDTLLRKSNHTDIGNHSIEDSKLALKSLVIGHAAVSSVEEKLERRENNPGANSSSSLLHALCNQAQAADTADSVMQVKVAANEAVLAAQQEIYNQPLSLSQVQAREADIRALADLTRALDKKEAILLELRNMNDDVASNRKDGDVHNSDMFQKHYATLLLQIKEVNQQVCGALLHLRQRNKYRENCMPPWQRQTTQHSTGSTHSGSLETNGLSLEEFPLAREVTMNAKQQARLMVESAVETVLCVKEGEDALSKISMVFNELPKKGESSAPHVGNGKTDTSSVMAGCHASTGFRDWVDPDSPHGATKQGTTGKDPRFLSDLMSTCVATLLMVQAFTERQYPPAEIAMAFDSVLVGLQPCSPQNYPIYREIQHYANLLKSQIIALIPTQSLQADCPLPHS